MVNTTITTSNSALTTGIVPINTSAGSSSNIDWNTLWDHKPISQTQLFAKYLSDNPLLKEGFKAVFSGFIREEFVKQTEKNKEITNEDLRNIADEAAKKFTEYLCNL